MKYRKDVKRKKGQPESAASILAQVIAGMGGTERSQEQKVFTLFDEIVGPHLRKYAQADRLQNGILFVRVSSSAMAHQVTMLREELISQLASRLPPGSISEIRTRLGSISAR